MKKIGMLAFVLLLAGCSLAPMDSVSEIPENCKTWFDGCNNCMVGENDMLACTRKFCAPEMIQEAKCVKLEEEESAMPQLCTMEYSPVCGVDGKTYGNKCGAGKVEVDYEGECK